MTAMRRSRHWLLLAAASAGVLVTMVRVTASDEQTVRPGYCAGSWYPGDRARLTEELERCLGQAPAVELPGKPVGIIAPHAGYQYSAPVAATAYRCLRGQRYQRVIALAFSHRLAGSYSGVDVPAGLTAYRTPLGDVRIDREVCDVLRKHPLFVSVPQAGEGEHSLELQVPFLQHVLGDFALVPLYVGRVDAADYPRLAEALLPYLDGDTLLVASTDFTHFGPRFGYEPFRDDVPRKLTELADAAAAPIQRCDFDGFLAHLDKTQDTICGRNPVALLLRVLSMRGRMQAVRTGFDTSGKQTSDWSNSVTYQAFVFTQQRGTLSDSDQTALLRLARETVASHLKGLPLPQLERDKLSPMLQADGACFVTLQNRGQLRGCIGNMVATGPLYESVMRNAVNACQDYRFVSNPVTAEELDRLHIEISYLTPMQPVKDVSAIVVGRHGLQIGMGMYRGVLLPQVAYERGWTRQEFLAQTCRKAGLPLDAWQRPEAEIHCFEAEVFGEPQH